MTLYVSDLDGTLLNNEGKLKPRSAMLLRRLVRNGALFSYATARGFASANRIVAERGGFTPNLPVITMNGVAIADGSSGELLRVNKLSDKLLNNAKNFFVDNNETPLIYTFIDGREQVRFLKDDTDCIKTYLKDRKGDDRFRPCKSMNELFEGEVIYITLINPRTEKSVLDAAFSKNYSTNFQRDSYHFDEYWYEIFAENVSKAAALKQLRDMLRERYDITETVVFGDNTNDISMFKSADRCYAVANALPELKAIATAIIASNEETGVPIFIESEHVKVWDYEREENIQIPDKGKSVRFSEALTKTSAVNNIGELSEKAIHRALKNFYATPDSHEQKIGGFVADIVNRKGITEIQTGNFGKLKMKLDAFLQASHVTIVYPFEKIVHITEIDEHSGEVVAQKVRNNKSLTDFFVELYRIKEFLTDPNLTVCIAELEIEKTVCKSTKKKRTAKIKRPLKLLREIYLENSSDYAVFLPEHTEKLNETFTKKEFMKLSTISKESILIEILQYMGIVHKSGKDGKSFLYRLDNPAKTEN
ncbi:hypothetical protein FACS189499_06930 [Clostridia bacterium]|nr:hypothetical protein FACS189499_06930 [Clostridia bacterium]